MSTHFLCGADMQEENNINFYTLIYRGIPVTMLYEYQYIRMYTGIYIQIHVASEALHTYTLKTDAAQNDVGKSPGKGVISDKKPMHFSHTCLTCVACLPRWNDVPYQQWAPLRRQLIAVQQHARPRTPNFPSEPDSAVMYFQHKTFCRGNPTTLVQASKSCQTASF